MHFNLTAAFLTFYNINQIFESGGRNAQEDRKAQISSYDCETQGQKLFMIWFLCSNLLAQQAVTG